ncbi:alpha/beta fold hydrolase [Noviherbaspirillum pedocola]|uniref:Alpha/beta hydrolase n=1 Tax=Noviherbaspirillum pedocola TaxID=2801341 RepID=A0A934T429_9BURK|nr:alpha/beta hydrolase [Noviherbaspirillum pedocola]MBK4738488.1 alpha/beta hydrolase [Noviherbaspirillum pedocola]
MKDRHAEDVDSSDVWVEHPLGKIFARIWTPAMKVDRSQARAPIVLFHDSLGCVDLWRDFPSKLSGFLGREVIAYDRLGFGRSDPRADMPPVDFVAEESRSYFPAIVKRFMLQRFVAFGHSVGGGMAVNCAADYPGACEALITESAQVFAEDRTLTSIAQAKEQFKDDRQLERLRKYHGEKAEWVLRAWTDSWLDPQFASWTLAAVLPRVTCPVLAIHGEHDEYGSAVHPEMITQLCSGPSKMEMMNDTYHVPHRERDADVLALVSRFLKSAH